MKKKFKIDVLKTKKMQSILIESGFSEQIPIHQIDKVYLSNGIKSFSDLQVNDSIFRIRGIDGTYLATMKIITEDRNAPVEYEYEFINNGELENIIYHLGFMEFVTIDKLRHSFVKEEISVEFDMVKKLGQFLEIEIVIDNDDLESKKIAYQKIADIQEKLGITNDQFEAKKYDRLVKELESDFN